MTYGMSYGAEPERVEKNGIMAVKIIEMEKGQNTIYVH